MKNGGGGAKVVEHSELTIARWYQIDWRKQEIDLAELAKLRWIDKMQIEDLARHFGCGSTKIDVHLRRIKVNPDSFGLGSVFKNGLGCAKSFRGMSEEA